MVALAVDAVKPGSDESATILAPPVSAGAVLVRDPRDATDRGCIAILNVAAYPPSSSTTGSTS
jgi:hypothetical protein